MSRDDATLLPSRVIRSSCHVVVDRDFGHYERYDFRYSSLRCICERVDVDRDRQSLAHASAEQPQTIASFQVRLARLTTRCQRSSPCAARTVWTNPYRTLNNNK